MSPFIHLAHNRRAEPDWDVTFYFRRRWREEESEMACREA
jgi:hypothetical protein